MSDLDKQADELLDKLDNMDVVIPEIDLFLRSERLSQFSMDRWTDMMRKAYEDSRSLESTITFEEYLEGQKTNFLQDPQIQIDGWRGGPNMSPKAVAFRSKLTKTDLDNPDPLIFYMEFRYRKGNKV